MIKRVTARANANIALIKYWGKQPGKLNAPATPSVSLALDKLLTETVIERLDSGDDRFFINGKAAEHTSYARLREYLNLWRKSGLIEGRFRVMSFNNFPTKSGLASSSSGYAALAKGLAAFSNSKISPAKLSKLARIGSGSAARSITGGLSVLPVAKDPAAKIILTPESIPWGMVVLVVESAEKEISSRQGMALSRKSNPYFNQWTRQAGKDYREMLKAITRGDFSAVGFLMESNMLAMHACMIATRPSLLYWNPATVRILHEVRQWRKNGLQAYATIDAGPHVAILGHRANLDRIARRARTIEGIKAVIKSLPAEGARTV